MDIWKEEKKDNGRGAYRWWLGTWNNPGDKADYLPTLELTGAQYGRGQEEVGKETATRHLQFVLFFSSPTRFSPLKAKLPPEVHIIGKPGAAKKDICAYVWKHETRIDHTQFEFGKAQSLTEKNSEKYEEAMDRCRQGRALQADPELIVKNLSNLLKLQALLAKSTGTETCRGIWIYGKPGAGKSHYARELSGESLYIKNQSKWWDGYQGERTVLLDDLDSSCLGHYLKIWADKYPFNGEIKGGFVATFYDKFIVTSNYLPNDFWGKDPILTEAVSRRFHFVHVSDRKSTWGDDFGKLPMIEPSSYQIELNGYLLDM